MRKKEEAKERQDSIHEIQMAKKRIFWRVAKMEFHSTVSKTFSISTFTIILGGR